MRRGISKPEDTKLVFSALNDRNRQPHVHAKPGLRVRLSLLEALVTEKDASVKWYLVQAIMSARPNAADAAR